MRQRDVMREAKQPGARDYLDCDACALSRHLRSRHRCGLMPRSEHATTPPEYFRPPGFPFPRDDEPTLCPGYLIRLPQVLEAARAKWWKDSPYLADRMGGRPTRLLLDLIEILASEEAELMAYETAKRKVG